jgi:dipeptidyl aminopeptidase/acylaminoacyl peptidase
MRAAFAAFVPFLLAAPAPAGRPSTAPDPPRPEDLARAAELMAAPPTVVEWAPRLSRDGKHLVFVTNAEGPPAIYRRELASGETVRVADLPRRFRRPSFSPDEAALYFTADEQGDEAYALHRLSLTTGAVELVTPGEKLRRDGPWFTRSGDRMFFTARELSASGTTLFVRRGDAPPTLVFASEAVELSAIHPDGAALLAVAAGLANEVFVAALSADAPSSAPSSGPSSGLRPLFPKDGREVLIHDVVFSPDGARALIATDDGGEQATIVSVDVRTGRVRGRYVEQGFAASRAHSLQACGDRIAFIVDAGVRHEVRILDARTLRPIAVTPPLPLGSSVPGALHPSSTAGLHLDGDGRRAVVQWSSPETPARIHLIDTRSGARTALTTATAGPAGAPPAFETSVAAIPSFDGLELPTLVHLPRGAEGRRLPVVVVMHGGFPYASTARFDARTALLLAEGYAVVEPNVRGSGGFGRAFERADDGILKLNAMRDLGAIARWVAARPWADPARLVLLGGSAGGYYTLLGLEHDPDVWSCGLALVPMYDLEEAIKTTDGDLRVFWETKELVPLSEPMLLAALSPSTWVHRIQAPLFLYAGARDARTPLGQSESLVVALRGRGHPLEFMRSDHGHAIDDPRVRGELLARMLRFLGTQCRRRGRKPPRRHGRQRA